MATKYEDLQIARQGTYYKDKLPAEKARTPQLRTGLSIWYGQVFEEYLPQLRGWRNEFRIFREMGNDSVISSLMEAVYTPLLSTAFNVQGYDDSDEQKRAVEFVQENLFRIPDQEWLSHVEDVLDFFQYGFAIAEKVLYKKPDGKLYIRQLIPIGQETLLRWGPRDEFGNVTGFVQQTIHGEINAAVMSKLLHFSWRSRKKDPQGRPLFRDLYRPWYFKSALEPLEGVGIERDVGNAPIAHLEEEFYRGPDYKTRREELEKSLDMFRQDEHAWLVVPPGVKIEAYRSGGKAYDIRKAIQDYQHLIRQRFFADFLAMGAGTKGTQSLARELNTFFKLALVSVQRKMLDVWNNQLIPWIFMHNNWKLEHYPQITWSDPSSVNLQSMAQAFNELSKGGFIKPIRSVIKYVAEAVRLPLSEADIDEIIALSEKETEAKNTPKFPVNNPKDTPVASPS